MPRPSWIYENEQKTDGPHLLAYLFVAIGALIGIGYYQFIPEHFTSGHISDAYSGQPIVGITLRANTAQPITDTNPIPFLRHTTTLTATTNTQGAYTFRNLPDDARIIIDVDGYISQTIQIASATGANPFDRRLRSTSLRGAVVDASSGQPVSSAFVLVGTPEQWATVRSPDTLTPGTLVSSVTGKSGAINLPLGDLDPTRMMMVKAPGYQVVTTTFAATSTVTVKLTPFQARAIYVRADTVATPGNFAHLVDLADKTGVNAFVIEVKGDAGYVLYDSHLPAVQQANAMRPGIGDLNAALATLKEHHIYAIARMVTFWDDPATAAHPDWAIQSASRHAPWTDTNNDRWLDPYNPAAVDYNLSIAKELISRGFNEVQFDAVGFPTVGSVNDMTFPLANGKAPRVAVQDFLLRAQAAIAPLGGMVAAVTYGLTPSAKGDGGGGLDFDLMAQYADYICPTLYPASFGKGFLGFDVPEQHPAEIVGYVLKKGSPRLADKHAKLRPWLQAFNSNNINYGPNEIKAETDTAASYSTSGWMLWNYGNEYDAAALGTKLD
ncbi:MAG: hypothetical protein DLM69_02930 [Candidatus Chloroheliales bacterium]|nr:MAG: hypothetical protein DLM69_02930 [Chloroflexota bacterium]